MDLVVTPKSGYVNDQFNVYWKIKAPEDGTYKLPIYLNGNKVTDALGLTGVFMRAGETKDGNVKIKTTKIGDNEVKAVLMEYVPGGIVGHWKEVETKTDTFIATTSVGGECTKEAFRDSMVNNYKKSKLLIGWYDNYSPILDVTETVKKVYPQVTEAKLTIFGKDLSKIGITGPYDTPPPARKVVDIVNGWLMGSEFERMYCSQNGKYYWVTFPCKLETGETPGPPTPRTGGVSWLLIVIALVIAGLFLKRRR